MTRRWKPGRHGALAVVAVGSIGVIAQGCLTRPVESSNPATTTNFTTTVHATAIDKIDLLFVIDNSASMGDKQQYLAQAVPLLIQRLVTPNCVDASGKIYGQSMLDNMGNGTCPNGGKVEFPPVHDMHIGVISTSLGARLADKNGDPSTCSPSATATMNGTIINNDDKAHLLNRGGVAQMPVANAGSLNYLKWYPANNPKNNPNNAGTDPPPEPNPQQLETDFQNIILGTGVYGCGIESQLESWYRFLIQPDPYLSLGTDSSNHAVWQGVDTTILKQRSEFLRPDSLVAIIDMTDENDSEIDVRSLGGTGWLMMAGNFDPPQANMSCAENSSNSGLTDPSTCASGSGTYSNQNDWGMNLNLRHVHMTQKYGVWPQFPLERYVLGLQSATIPDRRGEYPAGAKSYQGLNSSNQNCVNPLFAQSLPDGSNIDPNNPNLDSLCKLTRGPRTPDLVYYAHIGGVPHQLLQQDPTNKDSPQKDTLVDADWVKILGQGSLDPKTPDQLPPKTDPSQFDYTGIDSHMLESYSPRPGLPTSPPATDPISGYDWVTDQPGQADPTSGGHVLAVDREYACTFPLTTPRDCTQASQQDACDCPFTASNTLSPQQIPPICNPMNPTQQTGAKVYPTIRELFLAKLMKTQGFVSSLCPIHVTPAGGNPATDPLYGYNPAVNGIVDRLKVALNNQCLPQKLTPGTCGDVSCLILVTMPSGQDCTTVKGLSTPPADILQRFQQQQHQDWVNNGSAGTDPSTLVTCQMNQLYQVPASAPSGACNGLGSPGSDFDNTGSCQNSPDPGWCYIDGTAAQAFGCPQSILYSNGMPPNGATVSLQCVEQAITDIPDGGGGGSSGGGGGG